MSLDIDEFVFAINSQEGEHRGGGDPTSIEVFGDPYHRSRPKLVDKYIKKPLSDFVGSEKRHSCGNYILTDWDEDEATLQMITSPGYAGGYYYIGSFESGPSLTAHELPQIPGVEVPGPVDKHDQFIAKLGFEASQKPDAMGRS